MIRELESTESGWWTKWLDEAAVNYQRLTELRQTLTNMGAQLEMYADAYTPGQLQTYEIQIGVLKIRRDALGAAWTEGCKKGLATDGMHEIDVLESLVQIVSNEMEEVKLRGEPSDSS